MAEEQESPPIIVKKVKGHHGAHGGAWKVAYADFVTALMALFIVLWVMGQSAEVKEAVASYFKDPIGFSDKSKSMWNNEYPGIVNNPLENDPTNTAMEKERLKEMGQSILQDLASSKEFVNMMDQITIDFVDEGLRIEMSDTENDIFFEIGTTKLNEKAQLLLEKIGHQIAKLPNKIVVEGHTDSRPYTGDGTGYTNFELSAERANSARRALTVGGVPDSQFDEVRGYADRLLKDKNDPFNAKNRRISVIVKYSKSSEEKNLTLGR